ncbi:hypothetical protein B0H21DRAFT_724990 [Amylocystis lapponica]|nr:hypothetical protein B0H21DRAFT_724990 [Amylocystis lapponica]
MAAKPYLPPQDNTGSSALAQPPPPISLASPVLASVIPLPEHPLIAYSVFTSSPASVADHLTSVELARRKILRQNGHRAILESLLPSVHITKDIAALYVFALGSTDSTCGAHAALADLQLEGLVCEYSSYSTRSGTFLASLSFGG